MIPLLFMTASRESKLKLFNTTNTEAYSCLVSKDILIWVINLWRFSYSYLFLWFENLLTKQVFLIFAAHDGCQTQTFSLIFANNFDDISDRPVYGGIIIYVDVVHVTAREIPS